MDLIGPISPKSRQKKWILIATEVCIKWVEAVALSTTTGQLVANFIKENIICCFGVPRVILLDNGTPFINSKVRALLQGYHVTHHTSIPYYPKGSGQAEATNKTLLRILSRTLKEQHDKWAEQLPLALWGNRTTIKGATNATPFSVVYGTEAVFPIEITVSSGSLVIDLIDSRGEYQLPHRIFQISSCPMLRCPENKIRPRRGMSVKSGNVLKVNPNWPCEIASKKKVVIGLVDHITEEAEPRSIYHPHSASIHSGEPALNSQP
ncbi:uncharacterized protein LOC132309362 [Cornus florida]|uniref:uncharacterized protein LOC132309362 n=1 Tax=Cornus florida TaxID=4283 RepID=UPI002896D473|nr:uncharacterized protein LOC132309362 [Cornus florida]